MLFLYLLFLFYTSVIDVSRGPLAILALLHLQSGA